MSDVRGKTGSMRGYDPNSLDSNFTMVMIKLEDQDRERRDLHAVIREMKTMMDQDREEHRQQRVDILILKKEMSDIILKVEPLYVAAIKATTIAGGLSFLIMLLSDSIRAFISRMMSH